MVVNASLFRYLHALILAAWNRQSLQARIAVPGVPFGQSPFFMPHYGFQSAEYWLHFKMELRLSVDFRYLMKWERHHLASCDIPAFLTQRIILLARQVLVVSDSYSSSSASAAIFFPVSGAQRHFSA